MTACILGRLSNLTIAANTPFTWDVVLKDTTGGSMWSPAAATKLVIPVTGFWQIAAHTTTLGTSYGGPANQRVIQEIVRNWPGNETVNPHLGYDVVWERHWNENGGSAHGNSVRFDLDLDEGDELELLLSGTASSLLVESNPNGSSTLSPRFSALLLG